MKLHGYEYRDPEALIRELAREVELRENTAYLLLVAHPSTEQRLEEVVRLSTPALLDDWEAAREEMRAVIDHWPVPDVVPPTHGALLVVVRPGLCVEGPNEAGWHRAWRYINHVKRLYSGDLILVTEHGWRDFMTDFGGAEPAMVRAAA